MDAQSKKTAMWYAFSGVLEWTEIIYETVHKHTICKRLFLFLKKTCPDLVLGEKATPISLNVHGG